MTHKIIKQDPPTTETEKGCCEKLQQPFFCIYAEFLENHDVNKTQTFYEKLSNKHPLEYSHKNIKGVLHMSRFMEVNEKIAKGVTEGYKKIENGVVDGYKKLETGVVEGFNKVSDKFVEKLFAKDGETVEDAKKRLSGKE